MTRASHEVLDALGNNDFVRCIHSVGLPRPVRRKIFNYTTGYYKKHYVMKLKMKILVIESKFEIQKIEKNMPIYVKTTIYAKNVAKPKFEKN